MTDLFTVLRTVIIPKFISLTQTYHLKVHPLPQGKTGQRTDSTHLPQHLGGFPGLAETIFGHFLKLTA